MGIVTLLVFGFCFISYNAFLIHTTLKSAEKVPGSDEKKEDSSLLQKIFVNYLQSMALICSLPVPWPERIKDLIDLQSTAGDFTQLLISFDCFLNKQGELLAQHALMYP